jgi:GIY-YIG catalytic domain
MITIQELLFNRGLDKNSKIKIVRHSDPTKLDLYSLYRNDKLEFLKYQSSQSRDVFKNVNFIVSFIGEKGTLSRFIGVFKILKYIKLENGKYEYEMIEINNFEDLKERVIINWGRGTQSWAQNLDNIKEVIEIQPGLHYKQFVDYFDFILSFEELKEIVNNQYSDWKKTLSITKGIYLISDINTGKLYLGSAYGENGIWGRWSDYVKSNGHGNNKTLKELVENENNYEKNFTFSILMLLPKTITPNEAIKKETLYKNKLGTNSFGLNNN